MTDTPPLAGQVAIVTGARSGIGAACVALLRARGAGVVAIDRDGIDEAAADLLPITADVTDGRQVADAFAAAHAHYRRLDIVVTCAGIAPDWVTLAALDEARWDALMAVHVKATWLCIKHAWPLLTRPGGRIVTIAADCAEHGEANGGGLAAAKHAVLGLTRTAAIEGEAEGLRVNAISPSRVDTPIRHESAEERAALLATLPYRRLATPAEVAAAVGYLVSAEAGYVNGISLAVDGGLAGALAPHLRAA